MINLRVRLSLCKIEIGNKDRIRVVLREKCTCEADEGLI